MGGTVTIKQGITDAAAKTTILESAITKYYTETGPLIVQIDSSFTSIAANNAEVAVVNAAGQKVFTDTGNKYFLSGSYTINNLTTLPAGMYRIQLTWGSMDLGTDGYKDFELIKGRHPQDPAAKSTPPGSNTNDPTVTSPGTTKVTTKSVTVSGKAFKKNSKPKLTVTVKLSKGTAKGKVSVYVGSKAVKTVNVSKATTSITLPAKYKKAIKVKAAYKPTKANVNGTAKTSSIVTVKTK